MWLWLILGLGVAAARGKRDEPRSEKKAEEPTAPGGFGSGFGWAPAQRFRAARAAAEVTFVQLRAQRVKQNLSLISQQLKDAAARRRGM